MLPRTKALVALALVALVPFLWVCYRACVDPHGDQDNAGCAVSLLPSHEAVCSSGPQEAAESSGPFGF